MAHQSTASPVATAPRPETQAHSVLVAGVAALQIAVRWLFLIILAVLPIDAYLTLPGEQSGLFLSQLLVVEACGLLALLLLLGRLFKLDRLPTKLGEPPTIHPRDLAPLAAVLLVGLLSLLGAHSASTGARECARYAIFVGIFALALAVRDVPGIRHMALAGVVTGYCLVLVFGLLGTIPGAPNLPQILLNVQQVPATLPNSSTVRAASTFRFPDELNAYLLLVIPILVTCAIKVASWAERLAYSVLVGLGVLLLVLTYTRSAFLICVLILPLLLLLLGYRAFALIGLLGGALVAVGALLFDANASTRLLTLLSTSDAGYTSRLTTWHWAITSFLHHPLLGVGARNLQFQPDAPWADLYRHRLEDNAENSYLNVLAELGIIGFTCLVACLVAAVRRLWRGLRQTGDWLDECWHVGLLTGVAALLLDSLIHSTFTSGQITGLVCALVGLAGTLPNIQPATAAAPVESHARVADLLWRLGQWEDSTAGLAQRLRTGKVRVVFLINEPRYGGAEQHSMNLAAELWRQGIQVLVVVPPHSPLLPLLQARGVPCRALALGMGIGRWRGFLGTAMFLNPLSRRRALRHLTGLAREEPSIFVCPFLREQLLATRLSAREGSAVVWVLHSTLVYWPHRLLRPLWVKLAREADAVATVSPRFAEEVRALGFPSERLAIIPSSVPDALLERDPTVQPTSGLMVAVTRLVQTKGLQHLIAALPRVLERHPSARLAIAGTGHYEPELRKQVRQLGLERHVTFLGYVPEPATILRQASLFVYPSVDPGEVLPASILEALAVGVPVVASSLASIPEIVVDGATGRLTWPGDERSLAEAINALLDDPAHARTLGAAGRELVRAQYTFGRTGAKFLRLLEGLGQDSPMAEDIAPTPSAVMRAVHRPRLLSGTALFATSKVLTALGTALWTILAARVLLPAAYGNLMLAIGLVELGATVTDAGLSAVATRELASATDEREIRVLTSTLLYLKLLLGLAAMAATIIITLLLPFPGEVHRLVFVLAPSLVFVSISSMTLVFRARLAFRAVLAVSLITALLTIYSSVVVYILFPTDVAFAQARLVVAALAGLVTLAILLIWYRPRLAFSPRAARTLLAATVAFGLSQVLNIFFVRIDVPLLALLGGSTQVAVYTSAYRVVDVISLLPVSAAGVALPLMASIGLARRPHLRAFAQQYLELAVIAGVLVALALTLWSDPILALLYGGRYAEAGPVLRILGWASAAMFVTNVFTPLVVALDHRRTLLVATALGLVVNVGLNLLLIPRLGPAGAAWATLVTELVVTAPLAWVTVRSLQWRVDAYTMVAAFEAALCALGVALALRHLPGWQVGMLVFGLWALVFFILAPGWVVALVRSLQRRQAPRGPVVSRARPSAPPGAPSPNPPERVPPPFSTPGVDA